MIVKQFYFWKVHFEIALADARLLDTHPLSMRYVAFRMFHRVLTGTLLGWMLKYRIE